MKTKISKRKLCKALHLRGKVLVVTWRRNSTTEITKIVFTKDYSVGLLAVDYIDKKLLCSFALNSHKFKNFSKHVSYFYTLYKDWSLIKKLEIKSFTTSRMGKFFAERELERI